MSSISATAVQTNLPRVLFVGTNVAQQNIGLGNQDVPTNLLTISSQNTPSGLSPMATAGSNVVTITKQGLYNMRFQVFLGNTTTGFMGAYIIGSDGVYYALTYTYNVTNGFMFVQCNSGAEELPAGLTLKPGIYMQTTGGIVAKQDNTLCRFSVSCVSLTK